MLAAGEAYAEAVLELVAQIPPGRVMTYGLIAEVVAQRLHRGGPRQVGQVLADSQGRYRHLAIEAAPGLDGLVPWWRVVNASGRPPVAHAEAALAALRGEGTPLQPDDARVDLATTIWVPSGFDTLGGCVT